MITFAKFFQPVEVPTGLNSKSPTHHVSSKDHSIELEGHFIRVTHKQSGASVLVTIYNTAYLRDDNANKPGTPKAEKPNRAKRESDTLV